MDPTLKPITPWREPEYFERFEGRQDLIEYATKHEIPVGATKEHSYSEDENLLHISYESGELEDPAFPGHGNDYPGLVLRKKSVDILDTPDVPCNLTVAFERGHPVKVTNVDDGTVVEDALELFLYLNKVGGVHGVGRIDIVENRYVGMKSRGCYETPGGTILHHAHLDLETLTMDREVMRIRDTLGVKFTELLYNGFWFSPEMDFVLAAMEKAQDPVSGNVDIRLHKGNVLCLGRSSPNTLYDEDLVSMDKAGGFNPVNSTGFINTLATRLKASRARDKKMA
jgi:argininosuccinate synthase